MRWTAFLLLAAAAALLGSLPPAHGLSWPLCQDGGSVWVTERPFTGSQYPGANLWFFCDGQLAILGDSVDPCIEEGTVCTRAVSDAICKFLGYDQSYDETGELVPARPDEAVRSLTGEYCLRQGVYSRTLPANFSDLPGTPCLRINKITCIRTIESMAEELEVIVSELASANNTEAAAAAAGLAPALEVPPVRPAPEATPPAAEGTEEPEPAPAVMGQQGAAP